MTGSSAGIWDWNIRADRVYYSDRLRNLVEFFEGEGVLKTIEALRKKGGRIGEDIGKKKEGSLFDVAFSGSMIKDEAGKPLYMFGSFIDITERKRAEEALKASREDARHLAGRLLTSQETERARLARELHDDITQRLAILNIEVDNLELQHPSFSEPIKERLRHIGDSLGELSSDVHMISRQLHPSILDDLGLIKAIETECIFIA